MSALARDAAAFSVVIVREGGRSSIPEALVIERMSRGILDAPHARGMTGVGGARLPVIAEKCATKLAVIPGWYAAPDAEWFKQGAHKGRPYAMSIS